MPQPTRKPAGAAPPRSRAAAALVAAAALIGLWAVGVTVAVQLLGWLADQGLILYGVARPWWMWPAVSLLNGALVALPAVLLVVVAGAGAVAATGRIWLGGAAALVLLGAVRAVPSREPELYLGLLALVAAGLAGWWTRSGGGSGGPRPAGAVLAGTAGGLLVLLPWLWLGALGGALETLLAVVAAAAIGWLAASLLGRLPLAGAGTAPGATAATAAPSATAALGTTGRARLVVNGLVAGVALVLVAGGAGGSGAQLPLLLILPALGFAVAALHRLGGLGGRRWPVLMLVGLAALGPLALVDPEEISLLLTVTRDVPFWAAVATAGSVALAVPLSFGLAGWPPGRPRRAVPAALTAVLLVAAAGVYLGAGQPGLHGERLFVVLADQAELSGLAGPPGRPDTGSGPATESRSGAGAEHRAARVGEVYQGLVEHAEASQAELRAELDRLGLPYTPYYLVNGIEVAGGPAIRAWLSRRDDVDRVLRSQVLRPLPVLPAPETGEAAPAPSAPEWHIAMIGADRVWRELGVTGAGVVVGSSDSGVDGGHPALAGGFRRGEDSWLDPWHGTTVPSDRSGHGTHTLGSAVGTGGIGVAPQAQWIGCVNLDRGLGNPALYLDCLQFMLAPYPPGGDPWRDGRPDRAPHVLTNSWACPPIEGCDREVLEPATSALAMAGIYVVAAAGNAGPFCGSIQDPPAPHPDVLTVGAVDRSGELAFFSSRGQLNGDGPATAGKPDLVAPGVRVRSAMPGGGYGVLDGTSMATPQVAGVVALMWSANPQLVGDLATTTRILRATAQPVPVAEPAACGGPAAQVGAGLVDAFGAVEAALELE